MPNDIVILHGWSDTSKSFHPLADFLQAKGRVVKPLWLGDYISLDDDVRIPDVAKQMHKILQERIGNGDIQLPFDMIVHSTGGLVAREWLNSYYATDTTNIPIKRLLMLAPANYGSKLASLGQSMLGRVIKGWDNWFHTGKEMLYALELGSPYLWNLAQRDLLIPPGTAPLTGVYGEGKVWPFVITGSHPYPSTLRQIINEDGSDGTVRVPAANLNTVGVTLNFATPSEAPEVTPWTSRFSDLIPLAVLPCRTHASIINPDGGDIAGETAGQRQQFSDLILEALGCQTNVDYNAISNKWRQISEQTCNPANNLYHQYMQINVFVVDDKGSPVDDYFLEFSGPASDPSDDATVYFHRSVLEDVHVNDLSGAYRCLYVDRTDLMTGFYGKIAPNLPRVLKMSISANPPGKNVRYFANTAIGAKGDYNLHAEDAEGERWLKRNTTHFVKIVIPREPLSQVFTISTYPTPP